MTHPPSNEKGCDCKTCTRERRIQSLIEPLETVAQQEIMGVLGALEEAEFENQRLQLMMPDDE